MSYSVKISAQAAEDVGNIYDYIAFVLNSPENAHSLLNKIEKRIANLDELPNRHEKYSKEPWSSYGARVMPIEKFCVFYTVNESQKTVLVARVIYGGRDFDAEFAEIQ